MSSFTASAMGCNNPCGPTRIGPKPRLHVCIHLRSISTIYPAFNGKTATITTPPKHAAPQ